MVASIIDRVSVGGVLENSGYMLHTIETDFFKTIEEEMGEMVLSLQNINIEYAEGHLKNAYCEQWTQPIFQRGLTTFGLIFSVISSSILQISVPIMWQSPWIFQNTPNICIMNEFEGSYGHFSKNQHFFDSL